MSKREFPVTSGVRWLEARQITFAPRLYPWEEHGGTGRAAKFLQYDEHQVIKTLVMEGDDRTPFLVLMHGDKEVSTKNLARELGMKRVNPCTAQVAERTTGYQVGGISPFGTRHALRVCLQKTILELPEILINGGRRGFLVSLDPRELERNLPATLVDVMVE